MAHLPPLRIPPTRRIRIRHRERQTSRTFHIRTINLQTRRFFGFAVLEFVAEGNGFVVIAVGEGGEDEAFGREGRDDCGDYGGFFKAGGVLVI